MQAVLNLKSLVGALVIVILSASMLVAYYRNYSSGAGGHEHGEMEKGGRTALDEVGDGHAGMGNDTILDPQGRQMQPQQQASTSQLPAAHAQPERGQAAMGHDSLAKPSKAQAQPSSGPRSPQAGAASTQEQVDVAVYGTRPGIPGASHLYHIGATGFFLDHPQYIALTTEQQAGLNNAKEQALLAKSTADRAVKQAEQTLWTLTAADQPDAVQIEAKIREIEKLRGDERFAFIHAVGDASKLLTDVQRKSLTGVAPPAHENVIADPGAATPAGGMKDM